MNFVLTAKLSSVSQTAALISADLTPAKYQPVVRVTPLDTFQALPPESLTLKGHAAGFTVDWPIDGTHIGEVKKTAGYDKIDNPFTSFTGPWPQSVSARLAGKGIADFFVYLSEVPLPDSLRHAFHDIIERVIRDVCEKSKPGDDLIGKICSAVGFAMWGVGYDAATIQGATSRLSTILRTAFPGNAEESLAKMGQFFYGDPLWAPDIDPSNFGYLGPVPK